MPIRRGHEEITSGHRIETIDDIRSVPPDAEEVFVHSFDDAKARALAEHAAGIVGVSTDGNNQVTDAGVRDLARLPKLKSLDLEWSAVTDAALPSIAQMAALESVDLGFTAVTPAALQSLRDARPLLAIEYSPLPWP